MKSNTASSEAIRSSPSFSAQICATDVSSSSSRWQGHGLQAPARFARLSAKPWAPRGCETRADDSSRRSRYRELVGNSKSRTVSSTATLRCFSSSSSFSDQAGAVGRSISSANRPRARPCPPSVHSADPGARRRSPAREERGKDDGERVSALLDGDDLDVRKGYRYSRSRSPTCSAMQ